MEIIFDKAKEWLDKKWPFVLYSRPNSEKLHGIFQNSDTLFTINDFTETGFAFVSFTGNEKYIIPSNDSVSISESIVNSDLLQFKDVTLTFSNDAKNSFEQLVAKAILFIQQKQLEKVVLSRKETFKLDNFQFEIILKKLIKFYPNTLKYCFYHPTIGFWLGATPEQLLKIQDNVLETVSIAGTQLYKDNENYVWDKKEQEEQQIVTDYLVENLQEFSNSVSQTNPYTVNAGSIVHIKTDVQAILQSNISYKTLLEKMHPTPAVCGFPKIASKNFILENEKYDRKFYSGYLGELNLNSKNLDLFVNLRCMNIENNELNIYVGCGITKDSNCKNEFLETVNKSKTMKMVL